MKTKTGQVVTYFGERGFGFIREDSQTLSHWFFHISSCLCEPTVGLKVEFGVGTGRKGLMAVDVKPYSPLAGIEVLGGAA